MSRITPLSGSISMSTARMGSLLRRNWARAAVAITLGARCRFPTGGRGTRRGGTGRAARLSSTFRYVTVWMGARLSPNSWSPVDWAHHPHSTEELSREAISRARCRLSFQNARQHSFSTIGPPNPSFAGDNAEAEHKHTRHGVWQPAGRVRFITIIPGPFFPRIPPPRIGSEPRCGSAALSTGNSPPWPAEPIRPSPSDGPYYTHLRVRRR